MTRKRNQWRLALIALIAAWSGTAPLAAETIKVGGTGAAIGVMEALGAAFKKQHPAIDVVLVPGLGSGGGRKALLGGALDLAVTARAGNEVERLQDAIAKPYARSPFVLAVNSGVPVKNITMRELVDIYSGKKITWPNGERIRLILRPLADSDSELLRGIAGEMEQALKAAHGRDGMKMAITDEDSANAIESTPGGLGTSMMCLIIAEKRSLNLLSVNGMAPSVKAMNDGSYPWFKTFYLVSKPEASPSSRLFVEFVLSRQGERILSSLGHATSATRSP